MIRWFREIRLDDRPTVGGKGASLGELARAGINVPPGFVVATEAYTRFIDAIDPRRELRRRIERLEANDTASVTKVATEVRAQIEKAPVPKDVHAALTKAYATLCASERDAPVAVRSSATSEDSDEASFAGLQDTYLWVRGADSVVTQLRRCWASLYSEPSVSYRRRLKLPEEHVAMAVVVQRMVNARCAGVMFTRSPTTGDRSVIAIEAAWGLGSAMVSGEVTPDRYVVSKVTLDISKRTVSPKLIRHVPVPAGGVREEEVPAAMQSVPCLSDEQVKEVARVGKRIEQHYGKAQDIEWAMDESGKFPDNLYLLQSRPETVWASRSQEPIAKPAASAMDHVLAALSGGLKRK
ncbi:MAG: phosphoenolpyruvate synthase [Betaproteobacteria bacterium]|nr:phosphoenolpyruvate synthase [Betaproteobacteria bacterium]